MADQLQVALLITAVVLVVFMLATANAVFGLEPMCGKTRQRLVPICVNSDDVA
jgi:hypothetical protein